MAWKVYDAFPGTEGRNAVFGPMPCKRWIPVAGEKYKRGKRPAPPRACPDSRAVDERRAVAYARWLASRDCIALPDAGTVSAVWESIPTRADRYSKRIRAVMFGANRPDGLAILLPNWDFDPVEPVAETIDAEIVFLEMLPRGLAILAQAA